MDKTKHLVSELQSHADEILRGRKRNQYPKKNAPILDKEMLITLSGCCFRIHKQEVENLVLIADEDINFDNNVDPIRVISYIAGTYEHVAIYGWNWRPTRWKKNKLYLIASAPTSMN